MLDSRLMRGEQGGVAIFMLLAFMVLGVPLSVAAVQTAGQLSRSSQTYDEVLTRHYGANCGLENTFWQLLNDPDFDVGLTSQSPDKQFTVACNDATANVTVTKIFTATL